MPSRLKDNRNFWSVGDWYFNYSNKCNINDLIFARHPNGRMKVYETSLYYRPIIRQSFWHSMKISNWQRTNIDWVHFYMFLFFWKHYIYTICNLLKKSHVSCLYFYARNLWSSWCIDEIGNLDIHQTRKRHILCPFLVSKINFTLIINLILSSKYFTASSIILPVSHRYRH